MGRRGQASALYLQLWRHIPRKSWTLHSQWHYPAVGRPGTFWSWGRHLWKSEWHWACIHVHTYTRMHAHTHTHTHICVCVSVGIHICIYILLVLIGSHSRCNSFVVNQFLFFTPNGENSLCYTPKKEWEQCSGKKYFVYFLLAKYIPISHKNGRQKQEWRYPTACVGSFFIPDENMQTYLICLQSCNMQKHQKANFRTVEYVCVLSVQQWWLKVSITHVSWHVMSWNTHSLQTCIRSTVWTGENTAAINNKAQSMLRSEH